MSRLVLFLLLLFNILALTSTEAAIVGKCSVSAVYTSHEGFLFIDFDSCDGDLGWKKKRVEWDMNRNKRITTWDSGTGSTLINTFPTFAEVLAFKQTAELAFAFNLKVLVELQEKATHKITFLSLAQRFQIPAQGDPEWKPVKPVDPNPKPNRN